MGNARHPSLKKKLGQHHLVSAELCRPLVDFLQPARASVVEVGPGGGILTSLLLDRGARVLAIEMDPEWACALRISEPREGLEIVVGDAMSIAWQGISPGSLVTGNLPYQISTALIERVLPLHALVPRVCFLVQREVADRLVARPGDSAYGGLSVLVAAYSEVLSLGVVSRHDFRPPPKVDGGFVGFRLLPPPLPEQQMAEVRAIVRLAFGLRRKTLRNALAAGWGRERASAAVSALGRGDRVRAEQLDLDAFLRLREIHSAL